MKTDFIRNIAIAAAGLAVCGLANAQSRETGWEVGADLVYQDGNEFDFDGGTTVNLDAEWGISVTFGYRFNANLELQFALDWSDVDYTADLRRDIGTFSRVSGEMEAFTPRVNLQFNFMQGPFTPFVMGGVGYAFIYTNIPNGRPQSGCWWDPWYGYICTTVQPTRSADEFVYQGGVGIRWDFSDTGSLRAAYERHYIDLSHADSAPFVDQAKIGFSFRY
jgi:opacity protein-like surface antigen